MKPLRFESIEELEALTGKKVGKTAVPKQPKKQSKQTNPRHTQHADSVAMGTGIKCPQKIGCVAQSKMNKLERRYYEHLRMLLLSGEVIWFDYECKNIRLGVVGGKCWYKPDFLVQLADGTLEYHETKGRWEDDALVKIKTAARLYPMYGWKAVFWDKDKGWTYRVFG